MTSAELGKIIRQSVSRNQALTDDLLSDYCRSINIRVKKKGELDFRQIIQEYSQKSQPQGILVNRPPIVSIMGHIDHGKTTLLDTIRQTQVQKKEAGGITQKVSVSQAEFQGQKITFLDTPGHSDFIKMRQRGVSLTDLVVLVIDAKDGIMSQTAEIIDYLHNYQLPTLVFINHKKSSGEIIVVSGNAKEKDSVNHLLENILLFADFKSHPQSPAHGVVIDSFLHPQTGSQINELLIQDGTLKIKDNIFLNGKFGPVKIMSDILGQRITTAQPSDIVKAAGINVPAELGDRFLVLNDEKKKNVNLVLVADSQNSLEALTELVKKKNAPHCNLSVAYKAVGNLNSFALDLTKITNSQVLIFGYQPPQSQIKSLKEDNISFFSSKIIYEIGEKLDQIIDSQQEIEEVEEIVGTAVVKVVFEFSKGNIAGCQVTEGKISRNKRIYVLRGKEAQKIFTGEIKSLESNKVEKNEVSSGQECGIVLKGFDNFQEGDKIVAFQKVKREYIMKAIRPLTNSRRNTILLNYREKLSPYKKGIPRKLLKLIQPHSG
ncbi:13562_t:CDS:2, partial [Cetraspora pellucida]